MHQMRVNCKVCVQTTVKCIESLSSNQIFIIFILYALLINTLEHLGNIDLIEKFFFIPYHCIVQKKNWFHISVY